MNDRACENCKHHTEKGCSSWDCEFERRMTKEEIHREKEQAYMQGYEDACKKYRQVPKTEHWKTYLKEGLRYQCSACDSRFDTPWEYCPHCGAKMVEPQESERV